MMSGSQLLEYAPGARAFLMYLLVLTAVGLWPYQLRSCISCANGASLAPGAGIIFATPGIVIDRGGGAMIYERVAAGGSVTLLVYGESHKADQSGPARMASLSTDTWHRNLTLGQDGADLVLRLRTPVTGPNGAKQVFVAPDAIRPGHMQLFAATYDGAAVRIFVDGLLKLQETVALGDFSNWDPSYPLVLGNEATGDRPWLGTLGDVAIYARALSPEEIERLSPERLRAGGERPAYHLGRRCLNAGHPDTRRARFGACERPEVFTNAGIAPVLGFGPRQPSDYVTNLLFYALPGAALVLARLAGRRRAALIGLFVLHPALSEIAQSFVASRTSSLQDMLTAWAGLAVGAVVAAAWLSRTPRRAPASLNKDRPRRSG